MEYLSLIKHCNGQTKDITTESAPRQGLAKEANRDMDHLNWNILKESQQFRQTKINIKMT